MNLNPILRQAMLTPDELPGWAPLGESVIESSPFASTGYADRFTDEATTQLAHRETGEILVQHIGVLDDAGLSALDDDLNESVTDWPPGAILRESDDEAWAVAPLSVPPVGDRAIGFRLIADVPDAPLLLADNVYMRRGRVASALVRVDPGGAVAAADGIARLAELADRKLASLADKIR